MLERIGIAALLTIAGLVGGWVIRGWEEDAKRLVEVESYVQQIKAGVERDKTARAAASKQLGEEKARRARDRADFQRSLTNVPDTPLFQCPAQSDKPAPAAPPADDRRLDAGGFVGLWNDALFQGATPAERAGGADGRAPWSGPLGSRQLLGNLGENAERWAECRAQVRGWQRYACERGLAAPALCQ